VTSLLQGGDGSTLWSPASSAGGTNTGTLGFSSWYLSVSFNAPAATYTTISANLSPGDSSGINPTYGSVAAESGGVFSFADSGLWKVTFSAVRYNPPGVTVANYMLYFIDYSSDAGVSWEGSGAPYQGDSGGGQGTVGGCTLVRAFDITANSRVRFGYYPQSGAPTITGYNRFQFERLT